MLPLRLTVHNFMSYGVSVDPLDFTELNLVVLSGENGVGKSSLLEAINWAVWGKARVASDNDLIRLGEKEMEVSFDFEAEGETYRIIRKRQRKSRGGSTILEFQGRSDNEFVSLTEPTIKETQKKISDTIKLSYETFVNSAFIRQGHADEFTKKKATDRKAILGEVLGLYLYDELAQKAKEKVRIFEGTASTLSLFIEQIQEQLELKDGIKKELEGLSPNLELSQKDLSIAEEAYARLQGKKSLLDKSKSEQARLEKEEKDLLSLQRETNKKEENFKTRIKDLKKILDRGKIIEKAFEELKIAERKLENLREKREKLLRIQRERQELEDRKSELEHKFEIQIKELGARKEVLRQQIEASKEVSFGIQKVKKDILKLSGQEKELEGLKEKYEKLKADLAKLEAFLSQLIRDGKELKNKQNDASHLKGNCPTCQQKISNEHIQEIISRYQKDLDIKRIEYKKEKEVLKGLTLELRDVETKISKSESELEKLEELRRIEARLQHDLDEVSQKKLQLSDIHNAITKLKKEEKENRELLEIKGTLSKLNAEEKLQVYNSIEHQALEEQVRKAAELHEKMAELERARSEEELYNQRLDEIKETKNRLSNRSEDLAKRLKDAKKELLDICDFEKELRDKQEKLVEKKEAFAELQSKNFRLREKLEQLKKLEKELKRKEREAKISLKDKAIFEELATAFGKKGVQAMIIESIVPEIEIEANEILGRMTDNQMQIKFELQRPKRSTDGIVETLEIKVADAVGTRDYELFSGGEAFRINFAIRVALSKLLAHRAGAKLQLLVIDEGFGSQDQAGRDHLVAAINSIKDDFARIIVITHIEELKDAFPQRIEVRKGNKGSEIKVIT